MVRLSVDSPKCDEWLSSCHDGSVNYLNPSTIALPAILMSSGPGEGDGEQSPFTCARTGPTRYRH
jgi:hypothetical protein